MLVQYSEVYSTHVQCSAVQCSAVYYHSVCLPAVYYSSVKAKQVWLDQGSLDLVNIGPKPFLLLRSLG